jgi:hypothetical protein
LDSQSSPAFTKDRHERLSIGGSLDMTRAKDEATMRIKKAKRILVGDLIVVASCCFHSKHNLFWLVLWSKNERSVDAFE